MTVDSSSTDSSRKRGGVHRSMCSPPTPQIKSLDTLIEQSVKYSNRTVTTQNAMPVLCGQHNKIEKVQRHVARFVTNNYNDATVTSMLETWTDLPLRIGEKNLE